MIQPHEDLTLSSLHTSTTTEVMQYSAEALTGASRHSEIYNKKISQRLVDVFAEDDDNKTSVETSAYGTARPRNHGMAHL